MIGWNIKVRKRLVLLFYMTALLFVCLAYRLVTIQAFQSDRYKALADNQHIGKIEIPALRGTILDRKFEPLANSISLPSLAADPSKIKDHKKAALLISGILGCDRKELELRLSIPSTFAWIERKVTDDAARRVMALKIEGIFLLRESNGKRFYPKGHLGLHILGCTGIDDQGLDGIEASLDKYLKGIPGIMETEMDRDGRVIPGGVTSMVQAIPGYNIVLTIDESIQYIAESILDKAVKAHRAKRGSVVVMDAKTGEILALTTKPDVRSFDPRSNDYMKLTRNACVCDAYEPGSTFKVILAASALDSGKVKMEDQIPCGSSIDVGGWTLQNANDGFGGGATENIKEIITYSFNTGSAAIGLKIGCKTYFNYLRKFGFGSLTGVELPGETEGLLLPLKDWTEINCATMAFGQGIAITPVQLTSAVQAIANNGVQMKPHIIKQIIDSKGNVVRDFKPEVKSRPIKPATTLKMKEILQNVVEKGTGKRAKVPGYLCAGKTGTANVVENGNYVSGKYVASFVGFVPAEDPKIVILVKVEHPSDIYWGGVVAAPIFADVAKETLWRLGVPPSFPQEIGKNEEAKKQ
ncbi:MAG: penicillin-binding transpeptidase domain-containing protein [Candidatus Eremiobacteraeota bacterium]|nr:penicillin-binding transpeptidase domain-containing protein [Candidatus Eremiobacteraeota bacterium]